MTSEGMTVRSPSHAKSPRQSDMEDVEIGSSRGRLLKAKESDIFEVTTSVGENNNSREAESGSAMKSIIASTMYSGCSVGMVLVNKSLASR